MPMQEKRPVCKTKHGHSAENLRGGRAGEARRQQCEGCKRGAASSLKSSHRCPYCCLFVQSHQRRCTGRNKLLFGKQCLAITYSACCELWLPGSITPALYEPSPWSASHLKLDDKTSCPVECTAGSCSQVCV